MPYGKHPAQLIFRLTRSFWIIWLWNRIRELGNQVRKDLWGHPGPSMTKHLCENQTMALSPAFPYTPSGTVTPPPPWKSTPMPNHPFSEEIPSNVQPEKDTVQILKSSVITLRFHESLMQPPWPVLTAQLTSWELDSFIFIITEHFKMLKSPWHASCQQAGWPLDGKQECVHFLNSFLS